MVYDGLKRKTTNEIRGYFLDQRSKYGDRGAATGPLHRQGLFEELSPWGLSHRKKSSTRTVRPCLEQAHQEASYHKAIMSNPKRTEHDRTNYRQIRLSYMAVHFCSVLFLLEFFNLHIISHELLIRYNVRYAMIYYANDI